MDTSILSSGNDPPYQIAGPKTEPHLLPTQMSNREAVLVCPSHLPTTVPFGFDQQHRTFGDVEISRRTGSHTGRIIGVSLPEALLDPVPLGPPAGPRFEGQARPRQPSPECPSGCIERRCVFERRFRSV